MAKSRKSAAGSGDLFIEPSGQLRITDKPAEQRASENRKVECLGMTFESDEARRAYFLDKLREKLKDPEFRKIEGFPLGEDEDILALSEPPYYTACPNPFLADYVRMHGKPYIPDDGYHREPFAADVSEGKHDPVYKAHTYHTKVPPKAILKYLTHYTEPGDVVLDAFAGSGMTGVAAQALDGRHVILNDLSPAASHISANYNNVPDLGAFEREARRILDETHRHVSPLYTTNHKGEVGEVKYVVWSDCLRCNECSSDLSFAAAAYDREAKTIDDEFECPHCGAKLTKSAAVYAHETVFDPFLNKTIERNKRLPFLVSYAVGKKRYIKEADAEDIRIATTTDLRGRALQYHSVPFMFREGGWGCLYRAGYHFGITHSHHFFSSRNLITLDTMWRLIDGAPANLRPFLRFWFTATMVKCSLLMNYNTDGIGRVMKGSLYISSLTQEVNPLHFCSITLRDFLSAFRGYKTDPDRAAVTTGSASQLPIPAASIDYIFVDPPFGQNLIYSELNFLWESWVRVFTSEPAEAIVNEAFGKYLVDYQSAMTAGFREAYRVLKPGRWMTVEFHNSQNSVWNAIQEAMTRAGFVIADVRTLDKKHGSIKQVQTTGAVKQDLVISAYKPNGGLEARFELESGTEAGVWDFVRQHLKKLPTFVELRGRAEVIAERQAFLLFDRMVAFHIQRGATVPMGAAEFYAGLRQRFDQRDNMYFIPDQIAEYDRRRLEVTEIDQLAMFVVDEKSAIQWLRQELDAERQTYQQVQPKFLRELHKVEHEQLPELRDLLRENFLEDELGRWYVPDPNKQLDLEKLREKALLREFEEYKTLKQKRLKIFRTEAVRAGFKTAWAARDYQTIVSVAQKLPEDVVQEDQTILMYYDNASMRLE
jgi:DNA modification methylase/DNA-directed RNA polymerase subunit RPC12/RpoP